MYTTESANRFGKWSRDFQTFATLAEAVDAVNTEIVEGFATIDTVRVVEAATGAVVHSYE
jgi:hypothetical protein